MSGPRAGLVAGLMAALSLAGIVGFQPALARDATRARSKADVFLLPPPRELKAMSLGYRSALCDILWAKLLVEYGRHWSEKRTLEHEDLVRFLEGIIALDDDFPPIYKYVDTLLVYRPPKGDIKDARAARAYLERGARSHPRDPAIWLHYGEFVSYLAPGWLESEVERDEWRRDGALAIVRAVELGAKADRSLGAATLLSRTGEREAARRALERAYAVAEDDEARSDIQRQLERLDSTASVEERERRRLLVDRRRRRAMPFVSHTTFLLLGPPRPALACVGAGSSARPECPVDWPAALGTP
ncbi:MAG: hypothetical protein IPF92_00640 [Myxococcales bacterium]|nr:hypothetical protein [Myxococcales bacterium]MBL0193639.1 hypothetical protein [Myxococcales bacterium]HQY65599.1 hypothetical protein [Polyangiaceae bacterium]